MKDVETTNPTQPRYSCAEPLSFQPAGSLAQPMLATALAQRHGPGAAQALPSCRAGCLGPLHRNGCRYLQIHGQPLQGRNSRGCLWIFIHPPTSTSKNMLQEWSAQKDQKETTPFPPSLIHDVLLFAVWDLFHKLTSQAQVDDTPLILSLGLNWRVEDAACTGPFQTLGTVARWTVCLKLGRP
jgi:hypothetical protein